MALGGRQSMWGYNNQPTVSFDVSRCVGEEARLDQNMWGGHQLPIVLGDELINEKIERRETGRPLALDARHLMGGHNNQIKVGGEEMRLERNVWGGVVSLFAGGKLNENKKRKKIRLGLGRPPDNEITLHQKP